MRPQVFVELAAMGLFDDQDAFDAGKGGCEPFRLDRRQQARRDKAGVDSIRSRTSDRFARGAGERAPGDDRKIAFAFDARPMVAEVEVIELVAPLVELGQMVGGSAGRRPALGMGETVSRILTAARSRNGHWRHAVGRHGVALVTAGKFGSDSSCADECNDDRAFDGGA